MSNRFIWRSKPDGMSIELWKEDNFKCNQVYVEGPWNTEHTVEIQRSYCTVFDT